MLDLKDASLELAEIIEILQDPTKRDDVQQEFDAVNELLGGAELGPFQQLLHEFRRDELDSLLLKLETHQGQTAGELTEEKQRYDQQVREAVRGERANYDHMLADVHFLVELLESPEAVLALLEVVALTKIARIEEMTAYDIKRGTVSKGRDGLSPRQLRKVAADNLERAANLLQPLLEADPTGPQAVRTRFFLGVIRFRQAVPRRTPEEDPARDHERLRQAQELMSALVAGEQTDRRWRSYAELYLGLIATERGADKMETESRQASFNEARRHLDQAAELDTVVEEGQAPRSDSNDVIPYIYWRQQELIQRYEEAEVTPSFRSDFQLSVQSGARRDTNVVLLGERTDLPRGISKERDFGFSSMSRTTAAARLSSISSCRSERISGLCICVCSTTMTTRCWAGTPSWRPRPSRPAFACSPWAAGRPAISTSPIRSATIASRSSINASTVTVSTIAWAWCRVSRRST
jgi:tetratricopeptide (TPR) repeat protein